jgi:cold shock CspA family protein
MRQRYNDAVQVVGDFIAGRLSMEEVSPESFSELKGMFNRCVRQDQWDWFTVYTEFGRPPVPRMRNIAGELTCLRRGCLDADRESVDGSVDRLYRLGLRELLGTYQRKPQERPISGPSGWLYILSTRNQPDFLKIGMTQRPVEERVKEINSATGVPIPYSARRVFRVSNARDAERRVFERLDPFRIRPDREFFKMSYEDAVKSIGECLGESELRERPQGTLVWVDRDRGYGFLDYDGGQSVFLHVSEVLDGDFKGVNVGAKFEFHLGFGEKGMLASKAKIIAER